jgi:hypothetical protein
MFLVFKFLFVKRGLHHSVTADIENTNHILKDKCVFCEFPECSCVWQQSEQNYVAVPPRFVGYSNKLFPLEVSAESCLTGKVWRSWWPKATLNNALAKELLQ